MGGADVGGGEEGEEGDGGGGLGDGGAAALLAVHEGEDADDIHAAILCGFNGLDGAATGGTDVVDDDDGGSFFEETFDLAGGSMGLFSFADQEAVDEGWGGAMVFAGVEFEEFGVVGELPGGGGGDVGDEGVCAHGEAADGLGGGEVLSNQLQENDSGEAAAFSVEGGGAAIDVVVGLLAGGEGEVAEAEGVGGDEGEEGFAGGDHDHKGTARVENTWWNVWIAWPGSGVATW